MVDRPRVDLYCEDSGHEQFARALLKRLSAELGLRPTINTPSGRGGHGQAITEFKAWQRAVTKGHIGHEIPDLLVLLIDSNCSGWAQVRRDVEQAIDPATFPHCAIGCPDPHVERWCLADPEAVQEVLGVQPPPDPGKCERRLYKQLLRQTILQADQPILTSEMEYAPDLVSAMDLFRAGKNQPSLKQFVDGIRSALQQLR
jgi:hypothetical protein